ncbi:MAG: hypothetical protein ABSF71_24490 [Terriglobia bacterium]|jgi:hypothetical protein
MTNSHIDSPTGSESARETMLSNQSNDLPAEKPRCFVAYPSTPADRAESVEKAIWEIDAGGVVDIIGWKGLMVSGRAVIGAICEEIKNRQILIADVTGLNPNVLFELGYAIAHKKRVWLLFNPHIERAKIDFDRFQLLTTVGYATYNNSSEIVITFYRDEPYKKLDQTLYDELLRAAGPPSKRDALLYLRCDVDTEASMRIARRVASGPIRSVIDDPQEIRIQPFGWYVQQVTSAYAVVCHLLSTEYENWELHNAKHALVAGLAHGMAKPLLMLAHEPYASPLDYRDLLRKHGTAAAAESIFADWLLPYVEQYEKRKVQSDAYREEERAQRELRDITIGEPIAENESDSVPDYYVKTAAYTETLHSKYSIVVGRKGTGKTATLYALTEELLADPRNLVCVIKPVGYELEGLLDILRQELPRAEKGYLIESFWKFLLYTELAKSVYEQLLGKPAYYDRTPAEAAMCEFVEQYQSLITPEFSVRLESAVARLRQLPGASLEDGRRLKISELLHNEMLAWLRKLLGEALESKAKVMVLVDNLDKAWNPNGDLRQLSDLLFGLLSASRRVAEEFGHDASGRAAANLFFALFLRSDIYTAMLDFAKERDKLPARLLSWSDPLLLRRVIEERFIKSGAGVEFPHEVWERYFVPNIRGIPTWAYIGHRILPKPRDLIYLIKSALQFAVNRGRTRISENDISDGEKQYSRFALDSLIVETSVRVVNVQDLLLHFVQSSEIVTEHEVATRLIAAKIPEGELETVIYWFGQLMFFGFEVAPTRFEFLYDEQDTQKIFIMAKKTAEETTDGIRRFQIHPAFHAFLEIKPHAATTPGQLKIVL